MAQFVKPPVRPYSDLPVVGPWISRLGRVNDIFATPCQPTPMIYVKAAFHVAPRLMYLKVKPFIQALQWDRLTRRNHAGKKGIAKLLSEHSPIAPILDSPGWAAFQVIGDLALKAEWYFMIADRATEGLVNWASLAYIYSGCKFPGSFWISGSITQGVAIAGNAPGLIGPFPMDFNDGHSLQGTISLVSGQTGMIYASATCRSDPFLLIPGSRNWTIECRELISNQTVFTISGGGADGSVTGGSEAADVNTHAAGLSTFALFLTGDGGAIYYENLTFGCQTFPSGVKGVDFDP